MSSVLEPSVNFTGRLKIKQSLPSLPVAQGNLCVCVFKYQTAFILGIEGAFGCVSVQRFFLGLEVAH